MNNKEIQSKIAELISSGVAKSEVFNGLSGQGVKDNQLAFLIASYADPRLCAAHRGKVNVVLALMFVQAVLGFLIGFSIGMEIGPNAKWIMAGLGTAIPLLFAWGFHKNLIGAYNGYIALSIVQLPRQLDGFISSSVASSVALAIGIGMLAFVWYVRQKIFPDFSFVGPKKIKGQYVFSS